MFMSKEEWIKEWTSWRYAKVNEDVITFIANFLYADERGTETVYNLFASGYCYYFAKFLQDAFNRGEICWHRNYSHIVWRDDDGVAYDIGGVFYDYNEGDLLPVEQSLGDMIVEFMHTGEKFDCGDRQFHDWAEFYLMTDYYAVSDIYCRMPRNNVNDDLTVWENVFLYWMANERELSDYYAGRNTKKNKVNKK